MLFRSDDKSLIEAQKWDTVNATDNDLEVVYYRTTTSQLVTSKNNVGFDKLNGKTDRVGISPSRSGQRY